MTHDDAVARLMDLAELMRHAKNFSEYHDSRVELKNAITAAIAAERERCAAVCDAYLPGDGSINKATWCAQDIRELK